MLWWRAGRPKVDATCVLCKKRIASGEPALGSTEQSWACSIECAGNHQNLEPRSAGRTTRVVDAGASGAAVAANARRIRHHKQRILEAVESTPGLTSEQIARQTGIPVYDVRKRTAELRDKDGKVRNQVSWKQGSTLARWFPRRLV